MSPAGAGVGRVVAKVRRYLSRQAALAAVVWAAVLAAVVLLAAWWIAGPDGWGQGSRGPLLLDAALLVGSGALVVALIRAWARWTREGRLAGAMEEAAGLAPGTLLGSLELARSLPPGVSPSLATRGQASVLDGLRGSESRLSGDVGREAGAWVRNGLRGFAVLVPVVLLVAFASPDRSRGAWQGLSAPLALLAQPVLPPLSVEPGSTEVLRGSPLAVGVDARGRSTVTIHWREAGDVPQRAALDVVEGRASFDFQDVSAPLEYWVTAPDGARTARFEVTPVDPLFVSDLAVELIFPAHTGRLPEEYRGEVPPLEIPVGSRMRIRGQASRTLAAASLDGGEGRPSVELSVEGSGFEGDWWPTRSGTWTWTFEGRDGEPPEVAPRPLELTVLPDSLPTVAIVFPGTDTLLAPSLQQPLVVEASDDYGVARLELVAWRVTSSGQRMEPAVQGVELGGTRAAMARPLLDVSGWGLLPGDTVRYFARVLDNAPEPQVAETREYVLRMPGPSEVRREAQERMESAVGRVEELADEAGRTGEEVRDLERRMAARERAGERGARTTPQDEPMGFEDREDVRDAVERQEELLSSVDSLRSEMGELSRSLEDLGLADAGVREDLQELQELLDEMATPAMRERLQELAESLQDMDGSRAQEALEALSQDQEAFRERLERSLERFRRAALQQDFRATSEEAAELARQERALADALRESEEAGDAERRAEQQEELERRAQELEERMESLQEQLGELGEEQARQGVESAAQRSRESREAMAQAGQQARAGQPREAGEQAERAAESLQQGADELSRAQQEMAERMQNAMRETFRQTAEDALALARREEELRERMRGASQGEMAEIRGDQAALQQGLRNMAENLSVTSETTGGGDRELMGQIGRAMQAMEQAAGSMEDPRGRTPSPQASAESAIQALNDVALQAARAGNQVGQQGAQGGQSMAEQIMEQMQQLAQQQGQLNNQTGSIMPMQLGQQALQNQMQQLAQGQQSVAGQLGELSQQPGAQEGTLGDLDALAQEARRLAERLAGGRLDPETLQRQERLFHRLLDAGRSLEKDEYSEEREARRPGSFTPAEVAPLTPEALDAFRYALPGAAELQRLPPAQRQLVLDYFERLNRERSRPEREEGR